MSTAGGVRVGIVGVGNCASSLVQGVEFYRGAAEGAVGLRNPVCAGYAVGDVTTWCGGWRTPTRTCW